MKINPYILSFVGTHNSGKTTLLRSIIQRIVQKGFKVGAVKHTHHHDFEIDAPHKDSHILREAGAQSVIVSSKKKVALIQEIENESWQKMIPLLENLDLILVEGDKHSDYPKIEIYRKDLGQLPLYPQLNHIIAVCSDTPMYTPYPQFEILDVVGICKFVLKRMAEHKELLFSKGEII